MKRKNREISIFSMSALDLFASALGAFILVTLILMPYYKKEKPAPTENQTCEAPKLPICQSCPIPKETQCPPVKPKVVERVLADTFMMLTVEWRQMADLDMYVGTPDGWFGPGQYTIPGSGGAFIIDKNTASTPSIEMWKVVNPTPGTYTFCVNLFGPFYEGRIPRPMPPIQNIRAKARLDKPSGPIVFNNLTFTNIIKDQKPFPSRMADMNCFLQLEVSKDFKTRRL